MQFELNKEFGFYYILLPEGHCVGLLKHEKNEFYAEVESSHEWSSKKFQGNS